MKTSEFILLIALLGLGGAVIYLIMKQNQPNPPPPAIDKSGGQCGASYLGVGASVPCNLLGSAVKTAYGEVAKVAQPLTSEVKTASSGIKTWEYVVTPVAISHATYNEAKHLLGSIF